MRISNLSRCLHLTAIAVLLCLAQTAGAAPITLLNATTKVIVSGGEADNGLVPEEGYFSYTDLGAAEVTTWSIDPVLRFSDGSTAVLSNGSTGGFGSPSVFAPGVIRSTASVAGGGNTIAVTADTELVGSNARTTFSFSSTGDMAGTTFLFYAENDLFDFADDTAAFTGSIGGGNLALFQYDTATGGLTVRMTGEGVSNAALALFGAGIWTGWGTALEGGDFSVLSADGSNFETGSGDLGLALAFNLSGTEASLIVNYDTQPLPPGVPAPGTIALLAVGLLGLAARRRRA